MPAGSYTLVALADGTTSLYFSTGGGMLGGGGHEAVRAATRQLVAMADAAAASLSAHFAPAAEHPLPAPGRVRLYLRTVDGLRVAEADEEALAEHRHPLSPLVHAGHEVIAALRELSEAREAARRGGMPGDVREN